MKPFFFGDADKQLYGVYSPPAATAGPGRSVLICHPMGHEYLYAYRALCQLARHLSGEGHHVLRFDYFGTGNSAGDTGAGTISQWQADIRDAVEELEELSGCADVSLVGLRAGAALAAAASSTVDRIKDLVLWDPIVHGTAYLAELETMHREVVLPRSDAEEGHGDQLLGFPYSSALRQEMRGIDLLEAPLRAERIVLMASEQNDDSERLRARLESAESSFEYRELPGPLRWYVGAGEPHGLRAGGVTLQAFASLLAAA